jgi:acetolactate synthase-1/2/3 large subunit
VTAAATRVSVRLDGGTALARALVAAGVRDLFGVPAGKLGPFLAAVAAEPSIRHLGTRHESSAAWMAAATFHATGRLAACYGEMGPGAHNLVGGLGTARANGLAVLVLTSAPPTHLAQAAAQGMTMAADVAGLMRATTKWSATATSAERIPDLVRAAVGEALAGRPGPVHLGLPADVLATHADLDRGALDAPPGAGLRRSAPAELVAEAAALLRDAARPLLVAGGGVVQADAVGELRGLARRLGAATTATQMGLGAVSTLDSGFFGHGGLIGGEGVMRALREADVVLLAGCRVSSWLWDGSAPELAGPPGQAVVQLDVDPSAAAGVLPAGTLVLEGDARATLAALAEELGEGATRADPLWRESLVATYREHRARLFEGAGGAGEGIHPAVVAERVGGWLPDDALVVFDGGHTTFWSNDLTPTHEPRTRFHDPGMAHLGFGLPYALALQAAHPGRPVVLVTGDGAFGFTLAELDTARRSRLPVVTVIHDNAAWGVIRFGQQRAGFDLDTALEGTDYAAIACAFGCHGEHVTDAREIQPALDRALASGLPAVVDVRTRFIPHPTLPWFAAVGRR